MNSYHCKICNKNYISNKTLSNHNNKFHQNNELNCKHCNKKGGYLQVNHIKEWSKFPELRFDINNCETLCMDCHYKHTFNKEKPSHIKNWGHNLSKKLEKNERI